MSGTVADFMSREVITVNTDTPIKDVIQVLASHHIGGLPVVNGEKKLVGVLSETDLLWQESGVTPPPYITLLDSIIYLKNPATYERDLHKALGQTAAEVMTSKPITIVPDKPLSEAARIMHDRRIHRLFVVDQGGSVIGVITVGDIIRAMALGEA
ncbi:MAG: CBS domain-containing protein [Prochlorothrix sp.]|nr:CBS domain-containing protein [Prochlorothrix sp.]